MPIPDALKSTTPAEINITVKQGQTYLEQYQFQNAGANIDLTGCTATAKIKDTFTGTLLATFTCTIPVPADGTVRIALLPATTAALTATFPDTSTRAVVFGVWDFEVSDGTDIIRGAQGTATLSREVTT